MCVPSSESRTHGVFITSLAWLVLSSMNPVWVLCFPPSLVIVWRIVGALQFEFVPLLNASRSPCHVCAFVHHETIFQPDLLALLMKQNQLQGMGGYRLACASNRRADRSHTQHWGCSPHTLLLSLVVEDYCSAPTTRHPH